MATNNARNNKGQFPVGSVVKYDFTAPADTNWLLTNGASVSKTTYAPLYALQGNAYEGTGDLTEVSNITGGWSSGHEISWHPSSNYVALASEVSAEEIMVASFNGTTLTKVAYANAGNPITVDWHPNGNFLAIATVESHLVKVYSWNGTNSLTEVESIDITYGGRSVRWHPSGNFLAVGRITGGTDELSIYSWNGSNTLTQVETIHYSGNVYGLAWTNDGNYLAVGANVASHYVDVYSWNGSNTLTYICAYDYGGGGIVISLSWSNNGDFLAFGGNNDTKQLVVLSFNGSALTERATKDYGTSIYSAVSWSRGGNFLLTSIFNTSSTQNSIFLNTWVPSTYTLTQIDTISIVQNGVRGVGFNYTNNYFAYAGYYPQSPPNNILSAGTTALTSCDYRTNFPLPNIADKLIRAK